MRYVSFCVILSLLLGCTTQTKKDNLSTETLDAFTVVSSDGQEETPLVVVFGNSGSVIEAEVLYLLKKDGTFIWSNDKWNGGPPYYYGHVSVKKRAELMDELRFLKNVNSQVKFIPAHHHPLEYRFGAMNIFDEELLMSVVITIRATTLGLSWSQEQQDKELIQILQGEQNLSREFSMEYYADLLWDYVIQILEKYVPAEGQKTDNLHFKKMYVFYTYPVQK
ncbi:MAG: hypothetical protein ABFD91_01085 [Anaerohalosphaeraceae bacterium]